MRSWRNSFVTRWAALFASLIMAVVLISGWLRDRASRAYFLQDQRRHLTHRLEIIRVRLRAAVDGIRKDILYLSRAPAFARLAATSEGPEREAARREAAQHILGGLQVRPNYFQAQLIGVADGGRELIRFEQAKGRIQEVRELERLGEQDYFHETIKLPEGTFCLSDIDLNRESGRIAEPHTPTLRAATPVFDDRGKLFGIVLVSVDLTSLFEELRSLAAPDVVLTLSNGQGDYLVHPDPAKCFAFDLGGRANLFDEHPTLRVGGRNARFEDEPDEMSLTDEFPFTWECDKSLILRLALAKGPLLAPLQTRRAQNLAVTLLLAVAAGGVVMLVTNLQARGLRRVAEAVERYEPGKPLPALPPDGQDEVGLLARKFRDMAAKISEQMQGLREARQRAEAAVRAREDFLATMSHEIRTPMNAVLGMAHLLECEGNGPHQAEHLRTLKFASQHLMALLNNLLDRERIESGDIVLDRLDFDIGELIENLRRSLEPLADRKGLRFIVETGAELPRRVQGDPVRLYQVLNNLAYNAIKFTDHGQITLRVQPGPGQQVFFEVRDTGPGLPPPVLERLSGSAPQRTAGGLGMRISQRLIELLGGHLQFSSTSTGTTLGFLLPLPAANTGTGNRPPEQPPNLAGYCALIVEDVPSNQTVLAALLAKTGLTTELAATAAQAREKVARGSYDFVFVDIQLPDADGAELASALRQIQPDVQLLAVTAQVSPEVRAACESAGVRAFVPKPIAPAELYEKLRRLAAPNVEAIERLFDHNPTKAAEYFTQLNRECQTWESELRGLIEQPDAERLGRLHHRMKSAVGQLSLWKLDRTLTALRQAMEASELEALRHLGAEALRHLSNVTSDARLKPEAWQVPS